MIERKIERGKRGQMTRELIRELQKELITDENIGKYFGVTRSAIHFFRKNNGIKPAVKNIERNKKIIEMRKIGNRLKRIGYIMGLSLSHVSRIIKAGR